MQEKIIKIDKIDPKDFFGPNDRNINTIKSNFPNLKIVARGNQIKVFGNSTELLDFEEKIDKLIDYSLRFENIEDSLGSYALFFISNDTLFTHHLARKVDNGILPSL